MDVLRRFSAVRRIAAVVLALLVLGTAGAWWLWWQLGAVGNGLPTPQAMQLAGLRYALLLGVGACWITGSAGAWLVSRSIKLPVEDTIHAITRIASGDLETKVDSPGRDELACDWGQTAFDANPSLRWPAIHAAALLQLGQDDAARRAFEQHRALHAAFDGAQLARRLPGIHPALVAARERLLGCLQALAGQAALSASTFAPATSTGSRTARPIR